MTVFDLDKEGQNRLAEEAKAHAIQIDQVKVSPFQINKTEIAGGAVFAVAVVIIAAWRLRRMRGLLGWIAVNLFLLILILVGAGTFWLLGTGVKMMALDDDYERWMLAAVALASIFASYYAGKWLHNAADRLHSRRNRHQ